MPPGPGCLHTCHACASRGLGLAALTAPLPALGVGGRRAAAHRRPTCLHPSCLHTGTCMPRSVAFPHAGAPVAPLMPRPPRPSRDGPLVCCTLPLPSLQPARRPLNQWGWASAWLASRRARIVRLRQQWHCWCHAWCPCQGVRCKGGAWPRGPLLRSMRVCLCCPVASCLRPGARCCPCTCSWVRPCSSSEQPCLTTCVVWRQPALAHCTTGGCLRVASRVGGPGLHVPPIGGNRC